MKTIEITNDQADIIGTALAVYKNMLSEESKRRTEMFEPNPEEEEYTKVCGLIMDIDIQLRKQA